MLNAEGVVGVGIFQAVFQAVHIRFSLFAQVIDFGVLLLEIGFHLAPQVVYFGVLLLKPFVDLMKSSVHIPAQVIDFCVQSLNIRLGFLAQVIDFGVLLLKPFVNPLEAGIHIPAQAIDFFILLFKTVFELLDISFSGDPSKNANHDHRKSEELQNQPDDQDKFSGLHGYFLF